MKDISLLGWVSNDLEIWNKKVYICTRNRETNDTKCENSSVGRAQPCQGWGRGFESRFSLKKNKTRK